MRQNKDQDWSLTRKIPVTMATQHPDNIKPPYWSDSPFVSAADEVDECYRMFSDLGCDEYMWDWEGKFVDEAVVDRLFYKHEAYFRKNQLGKDKFLTFRIPNIWKERGIRLARALMGIVAAAHTAKDLGVNPFPLFEVILPMTTSAQQLITILRKFKDVTHHEKQLFGSVIFQKGRMEMIPLIEGSVSLLDSRPILQNYVLKHKKLFGTLPDYIRPFIARSDPAMDSSFVSATLAARGALSEYYCFQRETKIPVFPIIGAGGLRFRGGLSPSLSKRFLQLYSGTRTVTIQSSFRYDHARAAVSRSIKFLQKELPKSQPVLFSDKDLTLLQEIAGIFTRAYRSTIQTIAPTINDLAAYIPRHRERIPHTGHFGYSRRMSSTQTTLPRAITFTAVLYSLGIPPTLIGTGRGWMEVQKRGLGHDLDRFFPGLMQDIVEEGHYFNGENLDLLMAHQEGWMEVKRDIMALEDALGRQLGPKTSEHLVYRNTTSSVLHFWKLKKEEDLKEHILESARYRSSLG